MDQNDQLNYSIVIPVFNESANITASLTQVLNFMQNFDPLFEVIVVDDGSSDETVQRVNDYRQYHPEIKLIENPHKGKAYTVRTGVLASQGNYVLAADADMATPIDELKRFMVWLSEHDYSVVIGSREGKGAERKKEPFIRHFIGRGFNFGVRLVTGLKFQDTQCGFKLYTQEAAKNIFLKLLVYGENQKEIKKPFFGAFDVEVLYIAKSLGYNIKAVPVTWTYVKTARLNFLGNSIRMGMDVLKIRYNGLTGKYR